VSNSADFEIPVEKLDALEAAIRADPKKLFELSEDDRVQAAVDIMAARNAIYRADINRWLRDCVWTVDEATQTQAKWPSDLVYLSELLAFVNENAMVAIPKSRRMMVSWALAAWCTHRARFFPNNAIFWQSESEDKAAFVVQNRCEFIEDHIEPEPFRRTYSSIRTTKGVVGRITYRDTKSYIWGIPQGGDVLRTYTPAVLVMDECDFMQEGPAALTAALPAVEKGSKLILISSSNGPGGILAGICKDVGIRSWADVK